MTHQQADGWLRYTHLEKLYGHLPGVPDGLPALFDLSPSDYAAVRARHAAVVESAAADLLAEPGFAALVDALPFEEGQTVLAVGDSVTDDLQSWAEILRQVLDRRRPGSGIRVINAGLSAHTTAMVLRRWHATVANAGPDWILCALGGNDITRIGPEPTRQQASPAESVANLAKMRAIAPGPRWVWLTPLPVLEDRVAEFRGFRIGGSTWRNDDVRALAEAIHGLGGPVVDLTVTFGVPADPLLQGPDGVHPTLAGQAAIARSVVTRLAAESSSSDVMS